ncbi:MAG TPA: hypothetical protein VG777_09705, partial [Thermoanaerobaculia bacterium]|nr:hypothetical protein [Thermoanaerobaculia bacterium]
VDLDGGPVWLGRDRIATRLSGGAAGKISPFDPRAVRGNEVYRYVTGRARAEGEVPDSRFLDWYLRESPEPRLSGGHGRLAGSLELRGGEGSLSLALAMSGVRALYRRDALRGDAVLDLRLSRWKPAEGAGSVAGSSFGLADVSATGVADRAAGARDWWGKFEMRSGTLRSTGAGLELSGHAAAKCRDARPLYTLFGVGLPKWARGIAALDGLTASADVDLGPARVRVSRLDARGGSFTIDGDYRKSGKESEGAFLVSDGPLSVGVEVAGGKSRLKLAGAQKWFEGRR